MNPNFLHLFLFGDTKRLGGGEEVQKKIYTQRETNSAHKHICTYTHVKKKQGTSLTYECYMQMVGREQMLLHLIDLYVNCIQTFHCVFWAH